MSLRSILAPSSISEFSGCSIRISDAPDDADWDDFLETAPGSAFQQTSCWGRARATIGWRPVRLVVSEDGRVVAGAQMLIRPMPVGGNIGFVCRGPVVQEGHPDLAGRVFSEMMAMGRQRDVQYLVVQPPPGGDWTSHELTALGFRRGAFDIEHTATVRIDLSADLDELLARMSKDFRRNIKIAERRGVTVRRGSEADLPIFNHLKDLHSARLGYARRCEGYYTELWRSLAPRGHVALFISEYEGEPVSAQLLMPFGNTCSFYELLWSGEHRDLKPNELLDWVAIRWAKSEGYRFVDLEGIATATAEAVLSGKELPAGPRYSASLYKLKLGGQVVVKPASFDYVYNRALRVAYRCIPNAVMRSEWMYGVLSRFRKTGS
jgi:peptidoglycan pentaglycine glycine transferase (the first glycine)